MAPSQPFVEIHFIKDIGLFFEQLGMPRMAGRILGALLDILEKGGSEK
jgi:hypothetical protein